MLFTFTNHSKPVNALAVTKNGKRLLSASEDGTLKVWNLEMGKLIKTIQVGKNLTSCDIAQDGITILAGDKLGTIFFYQLEDVEPFNIEPPPVPPEFKRFKKHWWQFWIK